MTWFESTLRGTVAVVTGGTGGIGREIAASLLDAGAAVTLVGRTPAAVRAAVESLQARGTLAGAVADVSVREEVEALFARVAQEHGSVSTLVCAHGVYAEKPVMELDDEDWDGILSTNLGGCFLAGQAAARAMTAAGRGGRIVLLGSLAAHAADRGGGAYSASKAGVHLLARAMAVELAPQGITVNVIDPGFIRSPMSEPFVAGMTDEATGRFKLNPTGRPGEPSDIANAVLWLAQPATGFVTGQTLIVDGGERAVLHQLWLR